MVKDLWLVESISSYVMLELISRKRCFLVWNALTYTIYNFLILLGLIHLSLTDGLSVKYVIYKTFFKQSEFYIPTFSLLF